MRSVSEKIPKLCYRLFNYLYVGNHSEPFKGIRRAKHQIECWNAEKIFEQKPLRKALFTASMSAGKSTLINALLARELMPSKQEVCAATIDRFIFVVNKLDDFRMGEDSVESTLKEVKVYLESKGIKDPNIFPASALTALNIRTILSGVDLKNFDTDSADD